MNCMLLSRLCLAIILFLIHLFSVASAEGNGEEEENGHDSEMYIVYASVLCFSLSDVLFVTVVNILFVFFE